MEDLDIGYVCKVAHDNELGLASSGCTVYPTIEDLKENHPCWESCGIVKVRVEFIEVINETKDYYES